MWSYKVSSKSSLCSPISWKNVIPYFLKLREYFIFKKCHHIGNSTLWSASSRRCDHTKFHQNPAYAALFPEKSLLLTVYRGATASGTVPRAPGRSTCIGHTKDELRRLYGGLWSFEWGFGACSTISRPPKVPNLRKLYFAVLNSALGILKSALRNI